MAAARKTGRRSDIRPGVKTSIRRGEVDMQFLDPKFNPDRWARTMILSILYQDRIAHYLRLYVGVTVAIFVLMGIAGIISLATVLHALVYTGLVLSAGLLFFILKRRAWLLSIKDPELKRWAHASMLAYLSLKGHPSVKGAAEPKDQCRERGCTNLQVLKKSDG
jgi:hypothetical protein